MRVIFKCDICGSVFPSSFECEKHEENCGKNQMTYEQKQRFISDMSTAIVNEFIEDPDKSLRKIVKYLRETNLERDWDDKLDLEDCGFKQIFEMSVEINEESIPRDIMIDEIVDKCLSDYRHYIFRG